MSSVKISIDQAELNKVYLRLKQLGLINTVKNRRDLLRPAAQIVIDEAKRLVPKSSKPHHRYKDGKKIATYYPRNLQRSLAILGNIGKLSGVVIAGPKLSKGDSSGDFRGRRVDGWYAGIVEKKKPFLRPAFESKKSQANELILSLMQKKINEALNK